jgi:hypothetical protein
VPIAVPGKGTVLTDIDSKILPFRPQSHLPLQRQSAFSPETTSIPATPATLLQLNLLMQQRWVKLSDLRQVVTADLGATLEIFRVAGREFDSFDLRQRPQRIEDCISALGVEECGGAIAAMPLPGNGSYPGIMEFWEHSRSIAQYCRMIAENSPDICPDQAYIVGLLHGIGSLPALLGWNGAGVLTGSMAGLRVAQQCSVPDCVVDYFSDVDLARKTCVWPDLVRMAHGPVWSSSGIRDCAGSSRRSGGSAVTGLGDRM